MDRGSLRGKTIALPVEQGLGDQLLFARFLAPLVARARDEGGAVIVEAPASLVPLLAASLPRDAELVERDHVPERVPDTWLEPESLPHVFGTTVETIPSCPYLRADPSDVEQWRARLRLDPARLNVGVVWAAEMGLRKRRPVDDRAGKDYLRSVAPAALAPLARVPGVRWFVLQKGPDEDAPAPPGMDPVRLGPSLRDVGDTAAVASLLDLVITVDTSVANLVGGLGLPGWVLLPKAADWRWSLGDDPTRTIWYPSMTIFKQDRSGDWAPVIRRVAGELTGLALMRQYNGPLVGLRDVDEDGVLQSWLPRREAGSVRR